MTEKIIITGSSGLIGTKLVADFANQFEVVGFDFSNMQLPVDITDIDSLKSAFEKHSDAQAVIHLAAYTDVTGAYMQTGDKDGSAYKINVDGTKNVAMCAKEYGQHLIHMSTAYVFSGDKNAPYTEEDDFSPIEWYGQTKAYAEQAIASVDPEYTILRIDQPFRSNSFSKLDTLHRVLDGLKNDKLYPQFVNHYFGPTYIDDLSRVIREIVVNKITGLYHASSGESWTDFDFASAINDVFDLQKVVKPGNLDDYLKTANRPYQRNTALNCNRLKNMLDIKLKTILEAIKEARVIYEGENL